MQIEQMIAAHPDVQGDLNPALIRCIEECLACGQACTSCADACLSEESVAHLRQCIRLNLDCADVCFATARLATRRAGGNVPTLQAMLTTCRTVCELCAAECHGHDSMDHCRVCAECCERCRDACEAAAASLSTQ
jgi:hypothetical protein